MKTLLTMFVSLVVSVFAMCATADEMSKKATEIHVESYQVFFEYDDNKITDDSVVDKLTAIATQAKAGSNAIRVEGFADERGTHKYNHGLAERRISTVVSILSKTGLKDIEAVVYGEDESTSKYDGHSVSMGVGPDEGWAADRRVAVHILEAEVVTP